MPRTVVGLLAAVGTAASGLIASAHGDLAWVAVGGAAAATGLASFLATPVQKKIFRLPFSHKLFRLYVLIWT